ncbi:OsmC family protein [Fodinicurvata sediminis]|uniref:OsmC family protein n=1 Tax=Fodinicurvata sediminis TaxID=1121832 RepID=UPI0003B47C33|nr:OsmC family protein [Fodinicurvata sediminis]
MMTPETTPAQPGHMNGLDVTAALATIDAIKADSSLGHFQFRARNTWISGGENRSRIRDFYGAGREDDSRSEPFTFTNGEPPVLLGNNEGANPVEFLLHALAGCVTTTFVLHATARGITIEHLSTELEGDLDVQGLLALDESVPAGYEQIRIRMDVKANCSEEELADLIAFTRQHSPVCNTVCRPVPVMLERKLDVTETVRTAV